VRISICIPTYNRAATLAKAIASAQAQTHADIEIVVVDNHSDDGTEAMVRRARKLPYDKVVQQDLESPWRVKDHSFDAVVMVGVMEYIIHPAILFRRVHSKLVDGGLFGLTVPQKSKWYTDSKLKSYRRNEIVPVIFKAGFNIEFSETALGFEDAGEKVLYWNYLLRKTSPP